MPPPSTLAVLPVTVLPGGSKAPRRALYQIGAKWIKPVQVTVLALRRCVNIGAGGRGEIAGERCGLERQTTVKQVDGAAVAMARLTEGGDAAHRKVAGELAVLRREDAVHGEDAAAIAIATIDASIGGVPTEIAVVQRQGAIGQVDAAPLTGGAIFP